MALFGDLVFRHRQAAGLTQEGLSEGSGVSVRAIRDLERGRAKAAQRRSAEALADALRLAGDERRKFLDSASRGRQRTRPAPTPPAHAANVSCALPPAVSRLFGRDTELARLKEMAADGHPGGVALLVGHPGVGKTTLAIYAAQLLRPAFPDGCLSVDLRGMDETPTTPWAALDQLLRGLGVPPDDIPASPAERSNLFRSLVSDQRVLVLLDNAADEAQVRPLIASGNGCLTLVTCRQALSGLEAAAWLWLNPLPDPAAIALLSSIAGSARFDAEPEAARELAALCGNLPLAVRICGNRLAGRPQWSIGYLVQQLRDERTRLSALSAGDLRVRPAFEMSYHRLSPATRLIFRRLALIPGSDFGAELAAVATGTTPEDVLGHLDELVDASLLQTTTTPGRFRFHDLLRLFSRELGEAEDEAGERASVTAQLIGYLLDTATEAGLMFSTDPADEPAGSRRFGSRERAGEWLDEETSNWLTAQRQATRAGRHEEVLGLAKSLHWYSDTRFHQVPWDEVFTLGLEAARALGDRQDEAKLLNFLNWAHFLGGTLDETILRQAIAVAEDIGDLVEQAWALRYLAVLHARRSQLEEALLAGRQAVRLSDGLELWLGRGAIQNTLGDILRQLGRHDDALATHRAVLTEVEKQRDETNAATYRIFKAVTLRYVGKVLLDMCCWRLAAESFGEAGTLMDEAGLVVMAAETIFDEGVAWHRADERDAAERRLRSASARLDKAATRWQRAQVLAELADVLEGRGDRRGSLAQRHEAAALCAQVGTPQAREFAAGLASGR